MNRLEKTLAQIKPLDLDTRVRAHDRLGKLTMPYWALGRLMDLAEELAAMTGRIPPPVAKKAIVTMAADHGVTEEGVSLYPAEVTGQMVRNFVRGGAGVNALARISNCRVIVVDMGVKADLADVVANKSILSRRVAPGTANIVRGPAMTLEQARQAIEAGIEIAETLEADLIGTGDMGIGNTTASAAIGAMITGRSVAAIAGKGTGLDDHQLLNKIKVIERAIQINAPDQSDGLDVLAKVGGFEIGGIAGLILGAAAQKKPVIIDGFISTAGALIAATLSPASVNYMIAAHLSQEKGHGILLNHLGKKPLLDLDLRLGEGTGAALAMPIVEAAGRLLSDVATFDEAGVSTSDAAEPIGA